MIGLDDAFNVIMDFFKRTSSVAIAYAGLLVFDILLFVMVVTGKTDIPRWGCVFNALLTEGKPQPRHIAASVC